MIMAFEFGLVLTIFFLFDLITLLSIPLTLVYSQYWDIVNKPGSMQYKIMQLKLIRKILLKQG